MVQPNPKIIRELPDEHAGLTDRISREGRQILAICPDLQRYWETRSSKPATNHLRVNQLPDFDGTGW